VRTAVVDVSLSRDLTEQFKEKMRQTHSAEDLESMSLFAGCFRKGCQLMQPCSQSISPSSLVA
jgi:phosphoribosylaminoimidazole (AIR) synthetase